MELDAERRADEVRLYRGYFGEEIVHVYVSSAADCVGVLNVRAVFCDLAGTPIEERIIRVARTRTLAFRIARIFKPEFIYPTKEQPDHRAAASSNRRTIMS